MFLRRVALAIVWVACLAGCRVASQDSQPVEAQPVKPAADVIERHSPELMAIPGVVGVYEGETSRHAPCIRIMVVKRTADLDARLPKTLEGYPVEVEATGVIRPLGEGS